MVYHFLSAEYGLKDLRERRLKVSRIMDLNDPFELLGVDLQDDDFNAALARTKERLAETRGILCFSKNWSNPVQWSHYADRHRGLCLAFDVPEDKLAQVQYADSRLPIPEVPDIEFMNRLLVTKFSHWGYEDEVRLFVGLEEQDEGLFYVQFSADTLALRQVLIGACSDVTRSDVERALGDRAHEIDVFRVKPDPRAFEMARADGGA